MIVTTEAEYIVNAFNEEAIKTLNSEFIEVLEIELISKEDNWFDRLATIEPTYLKVINEKDYKASRKVIGEKQNIVRRDQAETF